MKRLLRISISVVTGLVGLAIGLFVFARLLGDQEIRYQGKSFSYWCEELGSAELTSSNRANAILNDVIIPRLTNQVLSDTNDSRLRVALVEALNGLPGLHIDFTCADGRRAGAIDNLAALGPRALAATPTLLAVVKLDDDTLCGPAAAALVKLHADPEVVIPILINSLLDRNGHGRPDLVEALGGFGPKAAVAVPELVKLLQDRSSKEIMLAVPKALKQIDPQAAAKAGIN